MWVLVGAVIIGELVPIKLGTGEGEVAPSTTFTFALLLSTGLAAAAIAVAVASGISDLIDRKRPSRSAFNVAQYVRGHRRRGRRPAGLGRAAPPRGVHRRRRARHPRGRRGLLRR